MTQLALFQPGKPAPGPARARRHDPMPSHAAAETINSTRTGERHEVRILAAMADRERTFHEIAMRCGLEPVQVMRRLSDTRVGLVGRGLVEKCAERECRCCGREMATWRRT